MGKRVISVSYHQDVDLLEVQFERKSGYYAGTDDDHVQVRYDDEGNVIGFLVDGVREISGYLNVELKDKEPERASG